MTTNSNCGCRANLTFGKKMDLLIDAWKRRSSLRNFFSVAWTIFKKPKPQNLVGCEEVIYESTATPEEKYKLVKSGMSGQELFNATHKIVKTIRYGKVV